MMGTNNHHSIIVNLDYRSLVLWRLNGDYQEVVGAHSGFIYSVSSNNSLIATAGEQGILKLWRYLDGKVVCIQVVPLPGASVWTVKVDSVGRIFAGCSDGHVYCLSEDAHTGIWKDEILTRLKTLKLSKKVYTITRKVHNLDEEQGKIVYLQPAMTPIVCLNRSTDGEYL